MAKKQWVYNPQPAKLIANDKEKLRAEVNRFIQESSRLSSVASRMEIRAGRVYLYSLHEQFGWDNPKRKYVEWPMARITLYDKKGNKCAVDWQNSSEKWMCLFEGDLKESLDFIEQNEDWFN